MKIRAAACLPPPGRRAPAARPPEDTVAYAIGDIHGRLDLLQPLLAAIGEDSAHRRSRRRVLVFVGDYLARGRNSRGVVETAMAPGLPNFEVVALKGNHEDCLLRFVDGDLASGAHWLDYDGFDAMRDYGVAADDPHARDPAFLESLRLRLAAALPAEHMAFFRQLRVAHREGGYYFAHAGVRPGVPLDRQSETDRMWIRERFIDSEDDHGAVVVHGHCIFSEPQVRHNRISIDTGAYQSGCLTCLVMEGEHRLFLQTA